MRTNLIKKREEVGLSRMKLADICDIDRSYVYLIEYGNRTPSVDIALRIAKALGVTDDLQGLFKNE